MAINAKRELLGVITHNLTILKIDITYKNIRF